MNQRTLHWQECLKTYILTLSGSPRSTPCGKIIASEKGADQANSSDLLYDYSSRYAVNIKGLQRAYMNDVLEGRATLDQRETAQSNERDTKKVQRDIWSGHSSRSLSERSLQLVIIIGLLINGLVSVLLETGDKTQRARAYTCAWNMAQDDDFSTTENIMSVNTSVIFRHGHVASTLYFLCVLPAR